MTEKILHTSDWHLGKKLFKRSRIEEQRLFIDWLLSKIEKERIKFIIIAGDIFDTPSPPNEALDLYFYFLEKATSFEHTPHIIIIAGNHDSANFIQAPSSILKKHNVHIKTKVCHQLDQNIISIVVGSTEYLFKCIPYFRSYELYQFIDTDELNVEHVQSILKSISDYWPKKSTKEVNQKVKTVIAHHALGDFSATGSEHLVSVMGLESISLDWLGSDFDYMALGHIHKTQKMSTSKNIYYSGSPIPMRFSETQSKNILIYQKKGDVIDIKKEIIPSFRSIKQMTTSEQTALKDIRAELSNTTDNDLEGFWEIKIKMTTPNTELIDAIYDELRAAGDQLLSLIPTFTEDEKSSQESLNINELNINQLFELYYREKFPDMETLPPEIVDEFNSLLADLNHGENP